MKSIFLDFSKKLITAIGLLFLILVFFIVTKTITFIIGDILPYTKIDTIRLPSSEQHLEYIFKAPSDSNYVLELHKKGDVLRIPEHIMQECKKKYPIIPLDFEALKNGGTLSKESLKNLDARVKRDSKKQACTREYLTGIVNWTMTSANGKNIAHGFLPNIYSQGRPANKLRSEFYYGLGVIKKIEKGTQITIKLDMPKQNYDSNTESEYIVYMKKINSNK